MAVEVRIVIPTKEFSPTMLSSGTLLDDLRRELRAPGTDNTTVVVADGVRVTDVSAALRGEGAVVSAHVPGGDNGPGVNRNRGAKAATVEWLVFLDDDVRVPPGWAQSLLEIINDPSAPDVIGGGIGSQRPANWFSQAAEDFVVRHREYPEGWYIAAAHLLVRGAAFRQLNGFDSDFDYGGEDWDFCQRAHALELTVDVTDRISVLHANATNWSALRQKATQYGRANAMLDLSRSPQADSSSSGSPSDGEGDVQQIAPREPRRIARWLRSEYSAFRAQGRPIPRAIRSALLQGLWMHEYFRSYARTIRMTEEAPAS